MKNYRLIKDVVISGIIICLFIPQAASWVGDNGEDVSSSSATRDESILSNDCYLDARENALPYVPGQVIVKIRGTGGHSLAPNALYSEAEQEQQDVLSRLKREYGLEREEPVFKGLHRKLNSRETTMAVHRLAVAATFPERTIPPDADYVDLTPIYILRTNSDVMSTCGRLRQDPEVEYAEPNYLVEALMTPNDPYYNSTGTWGQAYSDLWGLRRIECEQAWNGAQGNGVVVAVIDSGVDYTHPDLSANMWTNPGEIAGNGIDDDGNGYADDVHGYDFVYNDADPMDVFGHGTHCAGTIAAVGNNGRGVIGVAPQARIMAVKGLNDEEGGGYIDQLADCVYYAADNGAHILSNSWGGFGTSQTLQDAFDYAHSLGCISVAAAGNANADARHFHPANIDKVIVVSATDHDDDRCRFSNYGPVIDVAAPGGAADHELDLFKYNILSTMPDNSTIAGKKPDLWVSDGYWRLTGTSMACPHVAGVAALIKSLHPGFSNDEIRLVIRASVDDVDVAGYDAKAGYGRINAYKALQIQSVCGASVQNVVFDDPGNLLKVYGSAAGTGFQRYSLRFKELGKSGAAFDQTYNTAVNGGLLGEIDLQGVMDGDYIARLSVDDSYGNTFSDHASFMIHNLTIGPNQNFAVLGSNPHFEVAGSSRYGYTVTWGEGIDPASWSSSGITIDNSRNILCSIDGTALPPEVFITIKAEDSIGNVETVSTFISSTMKGQWPNFICEEFYNGQVWHNAMDVDSDGSKEIIVITKAGKLMIFNADGTLAAEKVIMPYARFLRPVAADLDGDGDTEIIILKTRYSGSPSMLFVYSLDSGVLQEEWSRVVDEENLKCYLFGGCIVEDLDNDGLMEIIISGAWENFTTIKHTWMTMVYDDEGTKIPGWPQKIFPEEFDPFNMSIKPGGPHAPLSAAGDIDGDPELEIVSVGMLVEDRGGSISNSLYVNCFDKNGNTISGWPKFVNEAVDGYAEAASIASPVIGDIDNDGRNEIVVGNHTGLYALDRDANILWSALDTMSEPNMVTEIILSDVDNDGTPEIICSAMPEGNQNNTTIYVYEGDGTLVSSYFAGSFYLCGNVVGDINKDSYMDVISLRQIHFEGWVNQLQFDLWDPLTGTMFSSFVGGIKSSPLHPPTICDLDNDGIAEVIATFCYYNSGGFSVGVWELDSFPQGTFESDWPVFQHDTQATGCYVSKGGPIYLLGDVTGNGEVTSYDASLAAQYAISLVELTPDAVQRGDVTGNGAISSYDASLIAQCAIGLIKGF